MTEPWRLVGTRPGWAGYLPVVVKSYELPDGTSAEWDVYGSAQAIAVLALTDEGEVVLARQFRPGPGKVLDELPGGIVDEGEEPLEAAARELLEETGYAGDLEMAGSSWHGAGSCTRRYVAVARHARQVADPSNEPGEFCEVVLVTLGEFRAHLRTGELSDVDLGYLALDHLGALGGTTG